MLVLCVKFLEVYFNYKPIFVCHIYLIYFTYEKSVNKQLLSFSEIHKTTMKNKIIAKPIRDKWILQPIKWFSLPTNLSSLIWGEYFSLMVNLSISYFFSFKISIITWKHFVISFKIFWARSYCYWKAYSTK